MSLSDHTRARLTALCTYLQANGFRIAQSRMIAAAHLLDTRALSLEGAAACSSALQLGPVLCSNAREQRRYRPLVENWATPPREEWKRNGKARSGSGKTQPGGHGFRYLGPVLLVLALLSLGAAGYAAYVATRPAVIQAPLTPAASAGVSSAEGNTLRVSGSTNFAAPSLAEPIWQQQRAVWPAAAGSAGFALLFLLGLWWLRHGARLERRRAALGEHGVRLAATADVQLGDLLPAMRALGLSFRQPLRAFGQQLNVRQSVEQSARRGGLFTGVYGAPRERRFLALVRRQALHDHQACIGDALAAQLCRSGADVLTFRFDADANVVEPYRPEVADSGQQGEQTRRVFPAIEHLLAANEHAECLLFCEPGALLDPLSGQLAAWSRKIVDTGHRCTVFTVAPARRDPARAVLGAAGIEVVSTDAASLDALVRGQRPAPPPGRAAPPHPLLHAQFHLYRPAPGGRDADAVCDAIRDELGYAGLRWVQACAVYPVIQWPLTHALGALLVKDPAERAALLVRIAGLVWFRMAYMPDWLRAALIGRLDRQSASVVRDYFWDQFAEQLERDKGGAMLEVMRSPWRRRLHALLRRLLVVLALSARASRGPRQEQLFARYLLGRNLALSMRIPQRVASAIQDGLRGPVVALALLCIAGAGVSVLYGLAEAVRASRPLAGEATVRFGAGGQLVLAAHDRDTGRVVLARRDPGLRSDQWRTGAIAGVESTRASVLLSADGAYLLDQHSGGRQSVFAAEVPPRRLAASVFATGSAPERSASLASASSDGVQRYLAIRLQADGSGTAVVEQLPSMRRREYAIAQAAAPEQVALGPSGSQALLMYDRATTLMRLAGTTASIAEPLPGPVSGKLSRIAWESGGAETAYADCSTGGSLQVWGVKGELRMRREAGAGFDCSALALSAGGRYAAMGSTDGRVLLVDGANALAPLVLASGGARVTDLHFDAGLKRLVLVRSDLAATVVDLAIEDLAPAPAPPTALREPPVTGPATQRPARRGAPIRATPQVTQATADAISAKSAATFGTVIADDRVDSDGPAAQANGSPPSEERTPARAGRAEAPAPAPNTVKQASPLPEDDVPTQQTPLSASNFSKYSGGAAPAPDSAVEERKAHAREKYK